MDAFLITQQTNTAKALNGYIKASLKHCIYITACKVFFNMENRLKIVL